MSDGTAFVPKRCKRQRSSQEHEGPRKGQRTCTSPAYAEELSVLEAAAILMAMKPSSTTAAQQASPARATGRVTGAALVSMLH